MSGGRGGSSIIFNLPSLLTCGFKFGMTFILVYALSTFIGHVLIRPGAGVLGTVGKISAINCHKFPGSIHGSAEIRIFVLTQLSILPG